MMIVMMIVMILFALGILPWHRSSHSAAATTATTACELKIFYYIRTLYPTTNFMMVDNFYAGWQNIEWPESFHHLNKLHALSVQFYIIVRAGNSA